MFRNYFEKIRGETSKVFKTIILLQHSLQKINSPYIQEIRLGILHKQNLISRKNSTLTQNPYFPIIRSRDIILTLM
jgi:hypothetical protein